MTDKLKTIKIKIESYRVDKTCDNCKNGKMYGNGRGITQTINSYWEHKCDNCGHIENYKNISYPYIEYVNVKK